jgi:peroxiredoxin
MQLCEWNPDTVTRCGLWLAEKAENSRYFFYYVFNHLYHGFSVTGKFNCDEAYVALIKKYLESGKLWWADDNFVYGAKMQLKLLEPTLAGGPAPELSLLDTSRNPFDLSKIKSKWLLLFFWDPECSHCASFYTAFGELARQPQYSEMTFVAVNIGSNYETWMSYIASHNVPFIHTMSDPEKKSLLDAWNLFATPRIFVLDTSRKIMLKDPDPGYLLLYLK